MTVKLIKQMSPIEPNQFKGDIKTFLENWIVLEEQLGFPIQYGCLLKIEYDYYNIDSARRIRINNTVKDISINISFNENNEYEIVTLMINDNSETFHRSINPFSDVISKFIQVIICYCEYIESKQIVENEFVRSFNKIIFNIESQ